MLDPRACVPLALVGVLALAGCGGNDVVPPSSEPTTSSSTPSSTPSPTEEPLSDYEAEPQVEVARKFAAAIARDVTADDRALGRASRFLAKVGKQNFPRHFDEEFGLRYPGPLPFTPVAIRPDGDIVTCMWLAGWGVDPKTGRPAEKKRIGGMRIDLRAVDNGWKVANFILSDVDCAGVQVRGVRS